MAEKLLLVALLALITLPVKSQPPQTPIAQPNAEQKAKLSDLARNWEKEMREADTARDKYLIQLYAILAELGHKPSETTVSWNEKGEPVLGKAVPVKTPPKEGVKP